MKYPALFLTDAFLIFLFKTMGWLSINRVWHLFSPHELPVVDSIITYGTIGLAVFLIVLLAMAYLRGLIGIILILLAPVLAFTLINWLSPGMIGIANPIFWLSLSMAVILLIANAIVAALFNGRVLSTSA